MLITIRNKRFNTDNIVEVTENDNVGVTLVTIWLLNDRVIHLYDTDAQNFLEWWDSEVKSKPGTWRLYKATEQKQ